MLAASACGVVALQMQPVLPPAPLAWWLGASMALPALAVALRCRPRGLAVALVLVAGVAGFGYAAWRAHLRLDDALAPAAESADLVTLVGVVDDLPQNSPQGARFAFAVERVVSPPVHVPARISLAWFAPRPDAAGTVAPIPEIRAGERWQLAVRLRRPHGYVNPAGFDLEAWLLEHNLRATGAVRDSPRNQRVDAFAGRPGDYIERARETVRARIVAALPGAPYAGVMVALAIGDQRAIPEAQWLVFNRTGVAHLVSISGLHVTVFAMLAGGLAGLAARRFVGLTTRVPARKVAALAGVLFAFAYVLLAGAEVPAVRTLLMLAVGAWGLWMGRPGTARLVWLWSLVAVLAWDPWASLAPGFWLSFGAVGLLLYAGSCRLPPPRARTWRARVAGTLREATRTQWVVTLGLVPGTLALFQQISVVSALANAIAIPVVTLAIVPLALAGIVLPADALWQFAHAVLAVLMRVLEAMAAWPAATWAQHAPPVWTVVVATLGVVLLLAPRGVPGRAWGWIWLLPLFVVLPPRPSPGGVRVTALDVGQGLAVVVETARHALVYDTGPRFSDTTDAGGRIVAPFLRAAGIRALDALVVSHRDLDHAGGALSLLQTVPVAVLYSSLPVDGAIVARAAAGGTAWRCQEGQRWTWDGVAFEILFPPAEQYARDGVKPNDMSCVLRVTAPGGAALLAGDVEAVSEAALLRTQAPALSADVLTMPHHGSRTSSTPAFVAAVAPRVAIVSAGYRNRFNHPRPDVLDRYERRGAATLRTDLHGAVVIDIPPDAPLRATVARVSQRRYWYDAPARGPPEDDADASAAR